MTREQEVENLIAIAWRLHTQSAPDSMSEDEVEKQFVTKCRLAMARDHAWQVIKSLGPQANALREPYSAVPEEAERDTEHPAKQAETPPQGKPRYVGVDMAKGRDQSVIVLSGNWPRHDTSNDDIYARAEIIHAKDKTSTLTINLFVNSRLVCILERQHPLGGKAFSVRGPDGRSYGTVDAKQPIARVFADALFLKGMT